MTVHEGAVTRLLLLLALPGAGACSSDSGSTPPPMSDAAPDTAPSVSDATVSDASGATSDRMEASDGAVRDAGPSSDAAADGADATTFAVCLADMSPTFTNLRVNLFPASCTSGTLCHGTAAATAITLRGGGGLDLESDVYTHLLGADGMGAPATNQEGAAHGLIRVKPGDPDNSFLLIKLQLMTGTDNDFGSGMPFPTPGSVCPSTLSTIRNWIAEGAANN